jgi:hypothetical protein
MYTTTMNQSYLQNIAHIELHRDQNGTTDDPKHAKQSPEQNQARHCMQKRMQHYTKREHAASPR